MESILIGHLLKSISEKQRTNADTDLKCHDLTMAQSRVLMFLKKHGGNSTQKEIQIFLNVSHPTVVGIITRMEQNGFLTCCIDEQNRRTKLVTLTEKALCISNQMMVHIKAQEQQLLQNLSPQQIESLREMLLTIYHNLEQQADCSVIDQGGCNQ